MTSIASGLSSAIISVVYNNTLFSFGLTLFVFCMVPLVLNIINMKREVVETSPSIS